MQDTDKISLPIRDIDLNSKDLTKIVTKYNFFFGGQIETKKKKVKRYISFGIKAGATLSNKESYYNKFTDPIVGKLIGAFAQIPLSGSNRHMFMRFDLNMNDMGFKFKEQKFKWDAYNFAGNLGYNFGIGKVRPYIGIGGLVTLLQNDTYAIINYPVSPSTNISVGKFNSRPGTFSFWYVGYALETGVNFGKFFVATRYESLLDNSDRAFNIALGYRIN